MDRGGRQASGEIDEVAQLMSRRSRPDALELSTALGAVQRGLFGRASKPLQLQRFTLLSRVGAGGLGVVYAAYDPQLDRKVAIKVLRNTLADRQGSSDGPGGLLAEAQAIARLSHPNVIAVHDVGTYASGELDDAEHSGSEGVFIVMEYVEGEDLEQYSRGKGRTWRDVVDRFIEAGQGLEAAHEAGIVHRDFKPQNALVGKDGRVRVLDFGLARAEATGGEGSLPIAPSQVETLDAAVAGTPRYMSPEQHRCGPVDATSDQFSFCASLLACLLGAPPFSGATLAELAAAKASGPESALRARELPPWLTRVLRRGLAPEPSDRFADMADLLRGLTRGRQRGRRRIFALGALALAVAGGAAVHAWSGSEDPCLEHRERLAGVWDASREGVLRESLEGTQRPYAEAAARSVSDRLDGYTRQWVTQRELTCRESLASSDRVSTPRLEREARCLDRRLAAADELARLVIDHPEEVVEHAVDAAAALPSIEDCTRATNPDRRDSVRSRVDDGRLSELQQQLARAQANFDAANYEAGAELAAQLVRGADTAGDLELRARGRLLLGRFEAQLARGREADETLFRAHELALSLGDAELVAALLIARAEVERRLLGRYEEAERQLRLARVSIDELGLGDDVRAQLEQESVLLRRKQGRYEEALAAGERALEIRTRRAQSQPSKVGDAYMALADVHYKTRDFVAAARHIRKAQAAWSRSQGAAHPSTSAGEQRLGDIAWRTGRYAEALEHHRRAYAIELAARGAEHPRTWMRAMGLANVHAALGHHSEAYPTLVASLLHFEQVLGSEHPSAVSARLNLGSALVEGGYPLAAEPHLRAALEQLEARYEVTSPSLPYVLLDLGRVRAATGRTEEALIYFEAALGSWEEALGDTHPKLAWAWGELGEAHLQLGDRRAAARAFRLAIDVHDVTTSDPLHLADLHAGLGRSLVRSEPELARTHAERAHELYGDSKERAVERVELQGFLATLR